MFRQCPVDARWSSWRSDWSTCSSKCKKRGEPVPLKSRSRTCVPEAYGGKNCSFLEDQARKNKQLLYKEEQACSHLPSCPRAAILGSWSEWSACAQTCYPLDQSLPQTERRRSCNEVFLSADETLSTDVATCEDLQEFKKYKNCSIDVCPIDAKWSSWTSDWSSSSGNCKERGEPVPLKFRSRTCIPEEFGGKNCSSLEAQARKNRQPLYTEEEACSELPNCPETATVGSWGQWSACAQTCYHEGQPMPQSERRRTCEEAEA